MNICNLPTELKLHILKFLDISSIRFVVAKVNREFNELSKDYTLFWSYKQRSYDVEGKLLRLDLNCSLYRQYLKELTIQECSLDLFEKINFDNLCRLCVTVSFGDMNKFKTLKQKVPNLKILELKRPIHIENITKCSQWTRSLLRSELKSQYRHSSLFAPTKARERDNLVAICLLLGPQGPYQGKPSVLYACHLSCSLFPSWVCVFSSIAVTSLISLIISLRPS